MPFRLRYNEVVEAERHMWFNRLRRREFIPFSQRGGSVAARRARAAVEKCVGSALFSLGNADANPSGRSCATACESLAMSKTEHQFSISDRREETSICFRSLQRVGRAQG